MDIKSKSVDNNYVAQKTKRTLAVVPRYASMLYTVLFLLFIDLLINPFSELAKNTGHGMIAVYVLVNLIEYEL